MNIIKTNSGIFFPKGSPMRADGYLKREGVIYYSTENKISNTIPLLNLLIYNGEVYKRKQGGWG